MPNINAQLSPLCSACQLHFQLLPLSSVYFSSLLATTTSSFLFLNSLTIHWIFLFLIFWYIRSLVFTWMPPMLGGTTRHYLKWQLFFFLFFWAVVKLFFPMKHKLCFITFICCPPCICSLESHGIRSVPGLPSENWTQWITSFELLICAKVPGSFTHFSCTMVSPISTLHLVFLYLPWRVKIPLRINRGREYSVHLKITITISNDNSWNWSWHMETDVLTWVVQCDLFYYHAFTIYMSIEQGKYTK